MKKKLLIVGFACMFLFVTGCSSGNYATRSFVRENTNLALIQKVAVLPFEGGGRAQRMREMTMTQLLDLGVFDVIDKGRVDVFLQQEGLKPGAPIDAFTLRRLGESLNVEAALLGSVEQETVSRGSARFPEITMTLRLVECESGTLLWQASGRGSGYSLADRLFGFAPKDNFEITMRLLRELFATMNQG